MSSMLPSNQNNPNKQQKTEHFGELFQSFNDFFSETPVRGFLQSIDDFFQSPFPPGAAFHVNTVENGKEYIITAELPGVKRDQIHLNVQGNYLTISIENQQLEMEEDEKNQVFQRRQFLQHASRTIFLPQPLNEKKIKASYRDGLLQIRVPQEKGRKINIED